MVGNYDWDGLLTSIEGSKVYDKFVELFSQFSAACKKTVVIKRRNPDYVWLTPEVLAAINYEVYLWKRCKRSPTNIALKDEFKIARNKAGALTRSAKRRYLKGQFEKNRFDTAKTWELTNQIRGATKKRSIDEMIEKSFAPVTQKTIDDFSILFLLVDATRFKTAIF